MNGIVRTLFAITIIVGQFNHSQDFTKCATPAIHHFFQSSEELSLEEYQYISTLIFQMKRSKKSEKTYETEHFAIHYDADGGINSVDLTDNNHNSIPDYVESIGAYFEYSFETLVTQTGFDNPIPLNKKYNVGFFGSDIGAYGYTAPLDGTSYIMLHRSFEGFPNNNDTTNWKGAAKVTAAHEFKHAIQYYNSQWQESAKWGELDATWAEEFVYPYVDDYHNYLKSSYSQIISPKRSLFTSPRASYGYTNAIWEIYLEKTLGVQFLVDLWEYRRTHTNQEFLESIEHVGTQYGKRLDHMITEYNIWNYYTGNRSLRDFGYLDAHLINTSTLTSDIKKITTIYKDSLESFASSRHTISIPQIAGQYLELNYQRSSKSVTFSIVGTLTNGEFFTLNQFNYSSQGKVSYKIPYEMERIETLGLIITNTARDNQISGFEYSFNYSSEIDFNSSFSIQQSPASNHIEFIVRSASLKNTDYAIYNILGQRMALGRILPNQFSVLINTTHFASGIYFARFVHRKNVYTLKFLKL